jgi:CheY-like chemotaxis protein
MPTPCRVALVGLGDAERGAVYTALAALPASRQPRYEAVSSFDEATWLIADAEHTPSVKLVLAAEKLKRTLWVGTPPPRGAVASVDRPLDVAALLQALDTLVERDLPPARRRNARAPRRALLVDDSEIALRFLETRLARFGLVTERALTSNRAIEMMAATPQAPYDFVFLDVELGPASALDGLALARHLLRQHGRDGAAPVVVFVSAHASPTDRARGALAGGDAYLGKPLDELELQRLMLRHGLRLRAAVG